MIIIPKTANPRLCKGLRADEYHCQCSSCRVTLIHPDLIAAYSVLRTEADTGLLITCGYRCQAHNLEVKGSFILSRHQTGEAIDIAAYHLLRVIGTARQVETMALKAGFENVIYYPDKKFFHFNI